MKKMKKIFALLIAMIMVLGMSATVFAEEAPTTGTITINKATQKTNNGEAETYTAYRIFDANPSGDGNDASAPTNTANGKVGYTADATQKAAVENSGLFDFGGTAAPYTVTLKEGKTAADVAAWFNTNKDTLKTKLASYAKTLSFTADSQDGNGKAVAKATGLPFGYYFVTSTTGSFVSIDTTNYNVVIEDKNNYGDPFTPDEGAKVKGVKAVNGKANTTYATGDTIPEGYAVGDWKQVSANVGDVLTYEVGVKTSNFVTNNGNSEKVTYVFVSDALGAGLNYEISDTYKFTVKIGGVKASEFAADASADAKKVNSASAPKYSIEWTTDGAGNKTGFTITIPWNDADGNHVFESGTVVDVEYSAKVNSDVDVVSGRTAGANAKNDATVKYNSTPNTDTPPQDPDSGSATTAITDTEKVYVYALAIKKVDGSDITKALEGATFQIKDANGTAIKATLDTTEGSATKGYYVVDANGTTDFVTDSNGRILVYGVAAGTYKATETVAPKGYNLLHGTADFEAITVGTTTTSKTVSTTTYYVEDTNGTYKKNDDGTFSPIEEGETVDTKYSISNTETDEKETTTYESNLSVDAVSIAVENNQGAELPSTGGIGTTIFYIIGAILVIGAGVVLVTRRRMNVQ